MKIPIKELGEIITGNTPSKKVEDYWASEGICFVKPDGIADEGITLIQKSTEYLSENARSKARVISKDAVFVTCIGSIGKVGIAADGDYAFNQQINVVVPNKKVLPRYLAYNLLFSKPRLAAIANAPVVPIINKTQFGEFILEIEENTAKQAAMVLILDKLSGIINTRKKELQLLDTLIKARFVEMCNDNPTHNHLRDFINRYNAERCGDRVLPVLSITKLDGMVLQSDKFSKRIASTDSSAYKVVPRGKLVQGIHIDERNFDIQDIVDVGIVSPAYKIWSVNCEKCIPSVLAFALRTDKTMNYIRSRFTGSVRRRESISFDDFMNTPIDLPSMYFQEQFASFVSQVDKSKVAIQKALDEAQLLFDSLMQEYFG